MKIFFKLMYFTVFLFYTQVLAQGGIDIDLSLFEQVKDSRMFYVGDIDFLKQGTGPNLFNLNIVNNFGRPVEAQLHFQLRLNGISIAEVFSQPFTLPVGPTTFTYLGLVTGTATIPATGEIVELRDFDVTLNRVPNLEGEVTATGKLPAGQYLFFMEVLVLENGLPVEAFPDENFSNNILTVTNPTTLELLYPGAPAGSGDVSQVSSLFPYFLWQSDAAEFNFFVYKKLTDDQSIQDVLGHEPILHVEGWSNQVFQYPTDPNPDFPPDDPLQNGLPQAVGPVRLLEPGHVYYWFVEAVVLTAFGENLLQSDVYQFKTVNPEETENRANLIYLYLRQILGDRYEDFMQSLQNAAPTGNILLNGMPVQVEALAELVQKLQEKKAEIQHISIDSK